MRMLWVHRDIDATAGVAWSLLVDLDRWPAWGPSIRRATLEGDRFAAGATGHVTTVVGASLPFRVTDYVEGRCWRWTVAGVPATAHSVAATGAARCRVGFGVPMAAAPYLVVCRIALGRLAALASETEV